MDQGRLKNLINDTRKILGLPVLNYADRDRIETNFQIYPMEEEEEMEIVLTFKKWVYPDKLPQETLMEIKIKINMNTEQKRSMFMLKMPDHLIPDVPLYVKRDVQSYSKDKNTYGFGLYISENHTEKGFRRNRTPFIDYTLNQRAKNRISKTS